MDIVAENSVAEQLMRCAMNILRWSAHGLWEIVEEYDATRVPHPYLKAELEKLEGECEFRPKDAEVSNDLPLGIIQIGDQGESEVSHPQTWEKNSTESDRNSMEFIVTFPTSTKPRLFSTSIRNMQSICKCSEY